MKTFFLLVLFVSLNSYASGEWWSIPRSEDDQHLFYVGISEGKGGMAQLQDKAFNKAMGELIREHFGMSIQINESAVEELQKEQFQVVTKQSSAPLFIKGVGIVRTYEKELDEGNRIYVQIRVDKSNLKQAIQNQIAKPGDDSLNTFGDSHDSKVDIKVKTHPQGALIHFSALDRRYSLQGQGDARFFLPRGSYQMVVSSPGYATVSKEILMQSDGNEENIILEELNGSVDLSVFPDDAKITFEGNVISEGSHKLQVGKTHKFKFSHPDYFSKEIEFVLEQPEVVSKIVKLEPKPSTLSIEVYPSNATITIDGNEVKPYKGKIELEPGKKNLLITAPGYFSHSESIYVSTNRDYPLKVVRLRYDDQNLPPSDKGLAYRLELNPFFMLNNVGYGGVGGGLHFEFYYISIGGGFHWTTYTIENGEGVSPDEFNASDTFGTVRLITPSLGRLKLFLSGTQGQWSRNRREHLGDTVWEEKKSYQGLGGGVRGYLTPKWSMHAEYFKINTIDKETKLKEKQDRLIIGLAYEF